MLYVALALTVGQVATLVAFLKYLGGRDEFERAERSSLLQRIQAPETAVAQHAADLAGPDLPAVDLTDDGAYWEAKEERDQMLARIEEMERA